MERDICREKVAKVPPRYPGWTKAMRRCAALHHGCTAYKGNAWLTYQMCIKCAGSAGCFVPCGGGVWCGDNVERCLRTLVPVE